LIEFDYYYEKGMTHRCIEPAFVIFQWAAWYVFGYCMMRQDFRMFKLMRLWDLQLCNETFTPREMPSEKRDFNEHLSDDKKLIALFEPMVSYLLIETYGLHCYTETKDGLLRLETGYTNRDFIISWLLGFGDKVRVLEPVDIGEEIKRIAANIYSRY
jgi:predicted DNA-binding transcriptional regulator YafY